MVRKRSLLEIGKQSEGAIQKGDQGCGDDVAEKRLRDGEIRNEPKCAWSERWFETLGEIGDFSGSQAVQKEMAHYQIVGWVEWFQGFWSPCTDVRDLSSYAICIRRGPVIEVLDHTFASVDRSYFSIGVD